MEDSKREEIIKKLKKLQKAAFLNNNEEARFAYALSIKAVEET